MCLPVKLCVYLNFVCKVQQSVMLLSARSRWWQFASTNHLGQKWSPTLFLASMLSGSSRFPKQSLHPLTQKLCKISLQYIPTLKGNFIPFYRCSDTSNELNKNMVPFLRIFVGLNARITSCCLPDDLRLLKSILCFRPLSASKICILSSDRY